MFHDEVQLYLESGKGGDGSASFRREKYVPKGGPDGGDGGNGGDVYIAADAQLSDLNHLASVRELKAENGIPGAGRKLYGRKGEDLTVKVPVGTRIYRQAGDSWRLIGEIIEQGTAKKVLRGGKGGLGNVHFATATNQAPKQAQPGEPAARSCFRLELQLIADVGIIGLPNAGKSTFLSIISDAKPKIADYPFTTLSPVLGVVEQHDKRLIVADIPGLIEGASEGKGLGHTFLRHIQRTEVILHLIESLSDDYARDYLTIRKELGEFDAQLLDKKELVAISKAELITEDIKEETTKKINELKKVLSPNSRIFNKETFSAVTKENSESLVGELLDLKS